MIPSQTLSKKNKSCVAKKELRNSQKIKKIKCRFPVLLPHSPFIFVWNIFSVIFFCYYITLMPFFIAFDINTRHIEIFEMIVDIFFIIDLILNFNVAYKEEDKYQTCRKKIAKKYLGSYFLVDLITSIPLSFLLDFKQNSISGVNKLFRLYKLPKLFAATIKTKLFNLIDILKILKFKEFYRYQIRAKAPLFRTIFVTIVTFLVMHIGACVFIFLGRMQSPNLDTWISILDKSSTSYIEIYTTAIYYCFVVLTTVGYGDVVSRSNYEMFFTLFWMVGGIAFYSFTISLITLFFTSKFNRKTLLEKKIISFEKYVQENKLPPQLREDIKKFLHFVSHKISYRWTERERNVIENLPLELKYDFFTEVHRELMLECPFFRTRDINFKVKIMSLLKPLFVKKGEYIWKKNDNSNFIIFIEKGHVDLITENIFSEDLYKNRRGSIPLMSIPSKISNSKRWGNIYKLSKMSINDKYNVSAFNDTFKVPESSSKNFCSSFFKWFINLFKKFCKLFKKKKISPQKRKKSSYLPKININSANDISTKTNNLIEDQNDQKRISSIHKKPNLTKKFESSEEIEITPKESNAEPYVSKFSIDESESSKSQLVKSVIRNTLMLKENDLFFNNKKEEKLKKLDSSDSLSENIKINLQHRKSKILNRQMTPPTILSSNNKKLTLKPSQTMNNINISDLTSDNLLLEKKPSNEYRNTRVFNFENNNDRSYDFCSNSLIKFNKSQTELEKLQKSMKKSKLMKSDFINEEHDQDNKDSDDSLSEEIKAGANVVCCSKEEFERILKLKELRFNTYINGSYLGEEEILEKITRQYNCRARTDVELMVLTKSDFEHTLLQNFPHMSEKIIKSAKEKSKHNENCVKSMFKGIQQSAKQFGIKIKKVAN